MAGKYFLGSVNFSDKFKQPNENPLSTNGKWEGGYTGQGNMEVFSNNARSATTGVDCSMSLIKTVSADQFAEIKIAAIGDGACGMRIRASDPPTPTGYIVYATAGSWTAQLIDGVTNPVLISGSLAFAAGDRLKATMVGSILSVYKNLTFLDSVSDSTFASGSLGMFTNSPTDITLNVIDTFFGGDDFGCMPL